MSVKKKVLGVAALMALSASVPCYAMTPEEDAALQKMGLEYNRNYDIKHGYAVDMSVSVDEVVHRVTDDSAVVSDEKELVRGQEQLRPDERLDDEEIIGQNVFEISDEDDGGRNRVIGADELKRIEGSLNNSVQASGTAYNMKYDSQNGYAPYNVPIKRRSGYLINRRNAPSSRPNGQRVTEQMTVRNTPQSVRPQSKKVSVEQIENDLKLQQAALEYNRRYDNHFGY